MVQPRPSPPGLMPEMPPSYLLLLVRYRAWPLPASLQTVFETLALRAELEALLRLLCMMGCQLVVLPFSLSALSRGLSLSEGCIQHRLWESLHTHPNTTLADGSLLLNAGQCHFLSNSSRATTEQDRTVFIQCLYIPV